MANRGLLQKRRLDEFLQWCREVKGLQTREGRGDYQVAQILPKGSKKWQVIFFRDKDTDHLTVPMPLVALTRNFLKSTK